ncbi:hypothetical protein LCB40_03330 [Lactobacillus corticis]|uniref:Uncharacterized protein n=1 Tax=Lactobacillus corticis TaxID=2201249 RepID=A0A916QHP5_9LACO|nr:hypothetical protein LCB40_03330 [Lactobacillus corticis]
MTLHECQKFGHNYCSFRKNRYDLSLGGFALFEIEADQFLVKKILIKINLFFSSFS